MIQSNLYLKLGTKTILNTLLVHFEYTTFRFFFFLNTIWQVLFLRKQMLSHFKNILMVYWCAHPHFGSSSSHGNFPHVRLTRTFFFGASSVVHFFLKASCLRWEMEDSHCCYLNFVRNIQTVNSSLQCTCGHSLKQFKLERSMPAEMNFLPTYVCCRV